MFRSCADLSSAHKMEVFFCSSSSFSLNTAFITTGIKISLSLSAGISCGIPQGSVLELLLFSLAGKNLQIL